LREKAARVAPDDLLVFGADAPAQASDGSFAGPASNPKTFSSVW